MKPIIKNKGSAIFIHISKKIMKTEGCAALKKIHLIKVLKGLKNNTSVKIVNQNRAANSNKIRTIFNCL